MELSNFLKWHLKDLDFFLKKTKKQKKNNVLGTTIVERL